ncbi:hypothetical protein AXF42_Ash002946 [Apostasia shenzhenica]|uniref:Cupin type-1 domain-containing protein n=1 Tax=Apostasia shenzhenica TaxID=1088818 RepID=A0A2I0A7Q4_9ASPA|nr:hypothetical protein AXF42_Ash002946 [Apostasia shenzhenica]
MANPRRSSFQLHNHHASIALSDHQPPMPAVASLSSVAAFLKKPTAFPCLLSLFLLLTWLSLRLQHAPATSSSYQFSSSVSDSGAQSQGSLDTEANLARLSVSSLISADRRGWLLDPVSAALDAGIHGGAQFCKSVHAGEIRPGCVRGNHRHRACNETFLIWGANTKFRLENPRVKEKGYAEVSIGADEAAIASSPSGTAHALINIDVKTTFFVGCQDCIIDHKASNTDYKVWEDLLQHDSALS